MAVKLKLKRLGKTRAPYYRIVVADARVKRNGSAIEEIGKYHPKQEPSFIEVNTERAQYWLSVGAQPTEPVRAILEVTGDWQKFKGLPLPAAMRVAAPKPDRKAAFEAAVSQAASESKQGATTPKAKAATTAKAKAGGARKSEVEAGAKTTRAKAADTQPGPEADQSVPQFDEVPGKVDQAVSADAQAAPE